MEATKFKTVDEYLMTLPEKAKELAEQLRSTIKEAAPEAQETISYNMPAYKLQGILVYFAAHKQHIGFYPASAGIKAFGEQVADYRTSKGTLQFPFSKPIPFDLVSRIVAFRAAENLENAKAKLKK